MTASHATARRLALRLALDAHERAPADRSGAHLAEHSFRFDTEAPTAATPRPRDGEAWTLAQTLQEIRLRGAEVARSTRGLRVRHAHLVPGLAAAVRAHEPTVRLWLDLGAPTPPLGWDDETTLKMRWLELRLGDRQPPVELRPGVAVTDWARFRASVEGRFGEGPLAPCADGLRRDLGDLFDRHAVTDGRVVARPISLAA